ncbi:acyltransferase [Hymenobacter sp. BT683]|uniref:Acyltransferase n=1 Tax=Hymenobacter jeongseonensis TaxID=2791027 RepID=A0ABS0IK30_9BACT|nr:acyltransferase [Hymenobacter jeongseonensis]MBF9238706.1 acyltransferase [Hymenobacter jeongseonensis]
MINKNWMSRPVPHAVSVQPQQAGEYPRKFELNLEALRGGAALIVVIRHAILLSPSLMKGYEIPGPWKYVPPGHLSVLIFFMLSGYVIGLTNKTPINSWESCGEYLKRRFIRLYPIYLLSIILTLAVAFLLLNKVYSWSLIIQHLTFLQVTLGVVIKENNPLWSLNYEVVYYVIFIVISSFSIRPALIIAISLLVVVIATVMPQWLHPMLASYGYGLIYWVIGLWLAKCHTSNTTTKFPQLVSFMLLFLSFEQMNYMQRVFQMLGLDISLKQVDNYHQQIVQFSDLSYLLFCMVGIMLFTDKKIRVYRGLKFVIYFMPIVYLAVRLNKGDLMSLIENTGVGFTILFYLLSLLFLLKAEALDKLSRKVIAWLIPLGSISYGIYVVHYPIIFIIGSFSYFSGSAFEFSTRMIIYLATTLSVGYLLEKKMQPFFRNMIIR